MDAAGRGGSKNRPIGRCLCFRIDRQKPTVAENSLFRREEQAAQPTKELKSQHDYLQQLQAQSNGEESDRYHEQRYV